MIGEPTPGAVTAPPALRVTVITSRTLGTLLFVLAALLLYLLFAFWPIPIGDPVVKAQPTSGPCAAALAAATSPNTSNAGVPGQSSTGAANGGGQSAGAQSSAPQTGSNPGWYPCVRVFGAPPEPISADLRLLIIVGISAALGSVVHVATSFSTFVGNRTFAANWLWWYLLRPPIGIALAFVFYFAIRGGILTPSEQTANINVFGIAALAGLVGLFSKQASDKLEETFTNLFRTAPGSGDDQRGGKLGKPEITSANPGSIKVGTLPPLTVTLGGRGFTQDSVVTLSGSDRKTALTSDGNLVVTLIADDIAKVADLAFIVSNPKDNTVSDPFSYPVTA